MADTIRSLADILTLFADNASGDISEQDLRDFVVSCQFLGPATYVADSSNKAVTLEVGKLTLIDLSAAGLDGNVIVTLPSPGTIGRRCGVQILATSTVTGSFSLAPGYCAELANSTSVNGAAYSALSTGSGKWGLWLAGERLVFVDAGSTWLVEVDGRQKMRGMLARHATTSGTPMTNNTIVALTYDTIIAAQTVGAIGTTTHFAPKRAGYYRANHSFRVSAAATGSIIGILRDGQATSAYDLRGPTVPSTGAGDGGCDAVVAVSSPGTTAGQILAFGFHNSGANRNLEGTTAPTFLTWFQCEELL